MQCHKSFVLVVLVVITSACQAEELVTQIDHCVINLPKADSLPSLVLTGTDAVEKSEFTPASVAAGAYLVETGGAVQKLVVRQGEAGTYTAERSYSEPGMPISSKTYSGLCIHTHQLLGSGLVVEFVKDGALMWEQSSGVEFIPADLWAFYKKEK